MNTRKLFFGFLALAFLAMTVVSTTVIDLENESHSQIIKKRVPKQ